MHLQDFSRIDHDNCNTNGYFSNEFQANDYDFPFGICRPSCIVSNFSPFAWQNVGTCLALYSGRPTEST